MRFWNTGWAMTFTIRFGRTRLPILVAGFSLAAVVSAAAQVSPQTSPWNSEPDKSTAEAAPDATDADIMKDIDVNKLDWSQLSADASALDGPSPKTRPAAKRAIGSDTSWSSNEKANGTLGGVGQAIAFAVLGHADRRRHDGGAPGHADDVGDPGGEARQWRQPAAIIRHRLGGDHRAWRRIDLGQDVGRSPRRSRHRSRASSGHR